MRSLVILGCLLTVACAGSAETLRRDEGPSPEAICAELQAASSAREAEYESCRAQSPAVAWVHAEAFDHVDADVSAALSALRAGETSLGALEAQRLGEGIWDLLDAVRPEVRDEALADRVENSIEALLREGDQEERESILMTLASAVGGLRAHLEPTPPPDACTEAERARASAWVEAEAACRQM